MSTIHDDPWAPYEPSTSDPWDLARVAHLHRRAAFGATWDELQRDLAAGPAASVERLLVPPNPSEDETSIVEGLRQGAIASGDAQRLKAYWLYRMRFGSDALRERLTLFWHGHFATSITKVDSVGAMADQNEALRKNALGRFADLLSAIATDPAMLFWLDGGTSRKGRPNENFAREFLELFTLGPGHYTEPDVREGARAFTGWVDQGGMRAFRGAPTYRYDATRHDDGSKSFLGSVGPWKSDDIIRITLQQPAAADFLARKLYRAFVDEVDEPTSELLEPLADALRSSDYSVKHVLGLILRSRHFFSPSVRRRRIKSPVEYALGLARTLEIPRSGLSLLALAAACDRQGQSLYAPPSVKGWDGGASWITSTTLLERLNTATDLVWGNSDYGIPPYDPLAWSNGHRLAPGDATGAYVALLLQDDLAPTAQALIVEAGRAGTADALRKALQRLLHCPEFQLA